MTFKSPLETIKAVQVTGTAKTLLPWDKLLLMGFLAGAYIAFGALLSLIVTAGMTKAGYPVGLYRLVFGAAFTVGLMLVVIAGSELFTGNCLFPTVAVLHRKASIVGLLKNWTGSYIGNFIGALFVAGVLSYLTSLIIAPSGTAAASAAFLNTQAVYNAKLSLSFSEAFYRGIGCNWLVCLAVYLAVASDDTIGKIFGIFFPIMAFVAIGFEHCVANMFFIPAYIFANHMAGNPGVWGQFLAVNLLPVTLGNIVGGVIFVAGIYWWTLLRGSEKAEIIADRAEIDS
jgi:formate/nitrite transporter